MKYLYLKLYIYIIYKDFKFGISNNLDGKVIFLNIGPSKILLSILYY